MKICFISTWLPKNCGIATYCGYLCSKLKNNKNIKIQVITEKENPRYKDNKITVYPTFNRDEDYSSNIINTIKKIQPDVVHIQHEFGIFGFDFRLIKLLEDMKKNSKVPIVVTLHTIFSNDQRPIFKNVEKFNQQLIKLSDRVIVHQKGDKNVLERQAGGEKNIALILHGTKHMKYIDEKEARKKINFPLDREILLLFGFIRKEKLSLYFIDALPTIFKQNPKSYLYIIGSRKQTPPEHKPYLRYIEQKLKKLKIDKRVIFIEKFVPEKEVVYYYNSADIVIYPYDFEDWGASGSMHRALGSGKPLVCSRVTRLDEVREYISEEIGILPIHTKEWARIITRILRDKKFRDYIIKMVKEHAERTSWENAAKKHYSLYKSLI